MEEKNQEPTTPPPPHPPVSTDEWIATLEQRRDGIQAAYEKHKRQALLMRDELGETERLRDEAATRVHEIGEQLSYLRGLLAQRAAH